MKGNLKPGDVAVLAVDGTIVFVEDVQATFAAVVALPEQRQVSKIFVPGRVGVKKISPYSHADHFIAREQLSARNSDFLINYETWRGKHGSNYVHRTPEELAAMPVTKTGPSPRASKRTLRQVCATCGQRQDAHSTDHEFVPVGKTRAPRNDSSAPQRIRTTSSATYTLTSCDLTAARAQPRGDKYNEGNRSFRVVEALRRLPQSRGTLEEVIVSLVSDGGKQVSNPQKVVRRTLHQLLTAPFGAIVSRSV